MLPQQARTRIPAAVHSAVNTPLSFGRAACHTVAAPWVCCFRLRNREWSSQGYGFALRATMMMTDDFKSSPSPPPFPPRPGLMKAQYSLHNDSETIEGKDWRRWLGA